jgi:hypothetical protein
MDNYIMVTIMQMSPSEAGRYELTITNESGEANCSWQINVTGMPGPPTGPMAISGVDKNQVVLGWMSPKHDGGSPISHYVVERRDVSREDGTWTTVASYVKELKFCVQGLYEHHEYEFRVSAVNMNGQGPPLCVERPVVCRMPFGKLQRNILRISKTLIFFRPTKFTGHTRREHDRR